MGQQPTCLSDKIAATQSSGDVLQVFETEMANPKKAKSAFDERARGVADESEELLSMEAIAAPKTGAPALTLQPEPSKAVAPKVEPVKLELATDEPAKVQPKAAATPAPAPAAEPASVTQPRRGSLGRLRMLGFRS